MLLIVCRALPRLHLTRAADAGITFTPLDWRRHPRPERSDSPFVSAWTRWNDRPGNLVNIVKPHRPYARRVMAKLFTLRQSLESAPRWTRRG